MSDGGSWGALHRQLLLQRATPMPWLTYRPAFVLHHQVARQSASLQECDPVQTAAKGLGTFSAEPLGCMYRLHRPSDGPQFIAPSTWGLRKPALLIFLLLQGEPARGLGPLALGPLANTQQFKSLATSAAVDRLRWWGLRPRLAARSPQQLDSRAEGLGC